MAKLWTMRACLADHHRVMMRIFGIVMAPFILSGIEVETVHLSVNSKNKCTYCTNLHCNLGRMAGMKDAERLNAGKTCDLDQVSKAINTFAVKFADNQQIAPKDLEKEIGATKAASTTALCWFLHWGSYSGLTLDSAFKTLFQSPDIFKILFILYYGPLFVVIIVVSKLLGLFPSNGPAIINQIMGVVLALVASIWIIPLGILGAFV
jgi:AhpD family alkylhydroperoxidase